MSPTVDHIAFKAGYKYQLVRTAIILTQITGYEAETVFIKLTSSGILHVKEFYAFDGPSGPTIDTKTAMRGSCVHDALYQLIRLGLLPENLRKASDEEYRRICLEDGMPPWRAWIHFTALRKFGASASRPSAERKTQLAP